MRLQSGPRADHDRRVQPDHSGVRFPPPLIFVGCLAVGWLSRRLLPPLPDALILGWSLIVAACALTVSAAAPMMRRGTPLEPWRPTTALVTTGVFRISRTAIYLPFSLAYAAIALAMRPSP